MDISAMLISSLDILEKELRRLYQLELRNILRGGTLNHTTSIQELSMAELEIKMR